MQTIIVFFVIFTITYILSIYINRIGTELETQIHMNIIDLSSKIQQYTHVYNVLIDDVKSANNIYNKINTFSRNKVELENINLDISKEHKASTHLLKMLNNSVLEELKVEENDTSTSS